MTITTELLDQAIQTLNNVNVPVGLLESIGIPVHKSLSNMISFRKILLENSQSQEEPVEAVPEIPESDMGD